MGAEVKRQLSPSNPQEFSLILAWGLHGPKCLCTLSSHQQPKAPQHLFPSPLAQQEKEVETASVGITTGMPLASPLTDWGQGAGAWLGPAALPLPLGQVSGTACRKAGPRRHRSKGPKLTQEGWSHHTEGLSSTSTGLRYSKVHPLLQGASPRCHQQMCSAQSPWSPPNSGPRISAREQDPGPCPPACLSAESA
jgi:hypothetical protein